MLRKRDMSKEISNSNLLETEIMKNQSLINQIDLIMENGKIGSNKELVSAGFLKNNLQLLNTLQSQKNIANNRQNYLLSEKKIIQSKCEEVKQNICIKLIFIFIQDPTRKLQTRILGSN